MKLVWSLPSWERGLKYIPVNRILNQLAVAPLVGAWIEIAIMALNFSWDIVAPLVGAWIEIMLIRMTTKDVARRSPRGSVD